MYDSESNTDSSRALIVYFLQCNEVPKILLSPTFKACKSVPLYCNATGTLVFSLYFDNVKIHRELIWIGCNRTCAFK